MRISGPQVEKSIVRTVGQYHGCAFEIEFKGGGTEDSGKNHAIEHPYCTKRVEYHVVSLVRVHGTLGTRRGRGGDVADAKTECFEHRKSRGGWVVVQRSAFLIRGHRHIAYELPFYLELQQVEKNLRSITKGEKHSKTYRGGRTAQGTH